MGATSLRFTPDRGPGLLQRILNWPRIVGNWERRIARRQRGRSGIVFGFRGPHGGVGQPIVSAGWSVFRIEIDGVVVARDAADSLLGDATVMTDALRPKWLPMRPGTVDIVIRTVSGDGDPIARLTVDIPTGDPVIVAIMPETLQQGDTKPAQLWSYHLHDKDRYDLRAARASN